MIVANDSTGIEFRIAAKWFATLCYGESVSRKHIFFLAGIFTKDSQKFNNTFTFSAGENHSAR
jgi:hypothetical protein